MREDYHVGYTTDKALFTQYKANPSSVLVLNAERFYTKFEPKWHIFDIKVRQIVFFNKLVVLVQVSYPTLRSLHCFECSFQKKKKVFCGPLTEHCTL